MKLNKRRIVITGGTGRFGSVLKSTKSKYDVLFPNKNDNMDMFIQD